MDWDQLGSAATGLLTNWGNAAIQSAYVQPFELQRMQLQALGALGYYNEGQPGVTTAPAAGQAVVIPTGLLILGVLALVLVMAD